MCSTSATISQLANKLADQAIHLPPIDLLHMPVSPSKVANLPGPITALPLAIQPEFQLRN